MPRPAKNDAAAFERENLAAALVIQADPARYPGLMQEWARLVLDRQPQRRLAA